MKRGLAIAGGVLLGLIVIIGAIGFFALENLNSLVKTAVEDVGSDVTGTEVSLGEVDISLTEGRGSLLGFTMTNPSGFKSDEAFKFDEVTVKIDLSTVTSDPIVINEVVILNPVVTYEIGNKEANLDRIQKNVESSTASSEGSSDASSGGEAPKIIIENLYFRGGKVNVVASQFMENAMSAELQDIHLKDIGKEENGATPGAIAEELMGEMLASVTGAISSIDISKVTDQLGEGVKDALKSVDTKAVEDGAGGLADEAGEAIKGLFGSDND